MRNVLTSFVPAASLSIPCHDPGFCLTSLLYVSYSAGNFEHLLCAPLCPRGHKEEGCAGLGGVLWPQSKHLF